MGVTGFGPRNVLEVRAIVAVCRAGTGIQTEAASVLWERGAERNRETVYKFILIFFISVVLMSS